MSAEAHINLSLRTIDTKVASTNISQALPTYDVLTTIVLDILSGTGVGQIDQIYAGRRTLASGATDVLLLNGTTLKDTFNINLTLLTLCGCMIINEDKAQADGSPAVPNSTVLTVGGGTNPITNLLGSGAATKVLRVGDVFFNVSTGTNGISLIVPGSAENITIVNGSGASNNYRIVLFGRST